MNNRSTKRERGFSLLEMLIAMTVGRCAGRGGAALLPGCERNLDSFADGRTAARFSGRLRHDDQGREPGRGGHGAAIVLPSAITPRYACDRGAEMLPRPRQPYPGDLSLAGGYADSLWVDSGIPTRANAHLQSKSHRCDHGGLHGTSRSTLNCYAGDRHGCGGCDLRTVRTPKPACFRFFRRRVVCRPAYPPWKPSTIR